MLTLHSKTDTFPDACESSAQSRSGDEFIRLCSLFIQRASEQGKLETYVDICTEGDISWAGRVFRKWLVKIKFEPSQEFQKVIQFLERKGYSVKPYTYLYRGDLDCAALKISWK